MNDPRSPQHQLATVDLALERLTKKAYKERQRVQRNYGNEAIWRIGGTRHRLSIERLAEAVTFWRNELARMEWS